MNLVRNPGFSDLTAWNLSGGATFDPAAGNDQYGCIYLANAGDAISQVIHLPDRPDWTLWASFLSSEVGSVDVALLNQNNQTVYTTSFALDGDGDWDKWQPTNLGLAKGSYTLRISFNDVAVRVDDVSAAYIPKTRPQLALLAHEDVAALSNDIESFTAPSSTNEGSYTKSVDAALYYVQAVNDQGQPDVRWLDADLVDTVVNKIIEDVLTGPVLAYYQTKTDFTQGPRSESFSQIASGIRQRYGLVPGSTHSGQRRMMVVDLSH